MGGASEPGQYDAHGFYQNQNAQRCLHNLFQVGDAATANAQGGMYLKPTVVKRNNMVANNNYNSIFGGSAAGSSGNVCNGVAC